MDKEKLNEQVEEKEEEIKEEEKATEISQAEKDRIASKAIEAYKRGEKDRIEKEVRLALEEAQRRAKMSEEEIQEEARMQALAELEEREKAIKQKETELLAASRLNEAGLPQDFIDFVAVSGEDEIDNRIGVLRKHLDAQAERMVKAALQDEEPFRQSKAEEVDKISKIINDY